MPDLRQTLITLYARHDVSELMEKGDLFKTAFGVDREALLTNPEFAEFPELNQIVKEQKQDLEALEAQYKEETGHVLVDPKTQVIECLKLLLDRAIFSKSAEVLYKRQMDVLKDLMLAKYSSPGKPWPKKYQDHLEFLYPKIRDWHLFFLSYTNHGAQIVNKQYQTLIEALIEAKKLDPLLKSTETIRDNNLLAEAIVQNLDRNNIPKAKGFYDKASIRTGQPISETVKTACESSFLFIQLVTRDALVFSPDNWPFQEYEAFRKANDTLSKSHEAYSPILKSRFLFAVAGTDLASIAPQGFRPRDYRAWQTHIEKGLYQPAPPNDAQLFQAAIDKIASSVTAFVEKEWIGKVD